MPAKHIKANVYRWTTTPLISNDETLGSRENSRLFTHIQEVYNQAIACGTFGNFIYGIYDKENDGSHSEPNKEVLINNIQLQDGILLGSIGILEQSFRRNVREFDKSTRDISEIKLDSPQKRFETYTFFAIHPSKQQLLIVHDPDMPRYCHRLIAQILTNALGAESFTFQSELFSQKTLTERLLELKKASFTTSFRLTNEHPGGMKSATELTKRTTSCLVTYSGKITGELNHNEIDEIISLVRDGTCTRFYVTDKGDPESEEKIDLLREIIAEKRNLSLIEVDLKCPALVYQALISAFNEPVPPEHRT